MATPKRLAFADTPDLLTEIELSLLTGRAVSSIQKDRLRGTGFPFLRIGKLVRYRKETVLRFLAESERSSVSDMSRLGKEGNERR